MRRKRDIRQHVNIKHKRLNIKRRDQWATGADFGRPFATQVANCVVILDYVRTTLSLLQLPRGLEECTIVVLNNLQTKACNSMGSTLVTVECTNEFIWLQEMIYALQIEKTYPWVGATDMMEDGKWKWISDTEKVNTDGWYSHEPNGGKKENCAHFFPKRWNDSPCGAKNGYICEKRISKINAGNSSFKVGNSYFNVGNSDFEVGNSKI
ncbi:hypothetical protein FSP39_020168 [Pinctada imbricata]|uniref:C-type lectin domain-containing protein n=1 Tax=Pinctada imbricata TaxID=66713 RepID=A0AA88XS98_PINIB|nr:hypothetical protein FSP39_020168 [Pinctada imbricata]